MTPAARVQAAIGILDRIAEGVPAEKALTNWARGARYAGSGDRAAVRDHVFSILRTWRSSAAMGGGETGRARMIGHLRQTGVDPVALFSGGPYAPDPIDATEMQAFRAPTDDEARDLPGWLWPIWRDSLGPAADTVAEALRHRAAVFLRVNTLRGDRDAAQEALAADGIETCPHDLSPTALEVLTNPRRIQGSAAFRDGLVELQDAASQAVVDLLPLLPGQRVLDFCAGGGGKALAMAARLGGGPVFAHDADRRRMADLPARAARAGAEVAILDVPEGRFDLVLCDAPCSGSGAWRRSPEGKWRLDPSRLDDLVRLQSGILDAASGLVSAQGVLAYATCSLLAPENDAQIDAFLARHDGWRATVRRQFLPSDGGDGFYVALLTRVRM